MVIDPTSRVQVLGMDEMHPSSSSVRLSFWLFLFLPGFQFIVQLSFFRLFLLLITTSWEALAVQPFSFCGECFGA